MRGWVGLIVFVGFGLIRLGDYCSSRLEGGL